MAHIEYIEGNPVLRDDWYIEDITEQCEWLTDGQALEVMELLVSSHDCEVGISWEVIEAAADTLGFYNPESDEDD